MPRSISRMVLWCGLLILAAAAGGCQRGPTWDLAPVEGTITQAGQPLAGIQVTFWADIEGGTQGPRTSSFTDAAGHYELRTDTGERGTAIGRYHVCLVDTHYQNPNLLGRLSTTTVNAKKVQVRMKPVQMEKSGPPRVPLSYGHPDKTPVRVEVQPGPQVIDFDVKGTNVEVNLIGTSLK
jgi:hypothetical protein